MKKLLILEAVYFRKNDTAEEFAQKHEEKYTFTNKENMVVELREFISLIINNMLELKINRYNSLITSKIIEEIRKQIVLIFQVDI